jgi:CDP-diacylglycerol--inositol 3-phosphatidyltransferase
MALSKFLYIPNLIGYLRVILMFAAYYIADAKPIIAGCLYASSQLLDMMDGWAARKFNQATNFGAMLDMVTDRCSGIGLMMLVAFRRPNLTLFCHAVIWLDICSHWAHMKIQAESGEKSHKDVRSGFRLLQYYYKTKWFMVLLIVGAEGYPIYLYLSSFPDLFPEWFQPLVPVAGIVFLPLFSLKHFINVLQFIRASILLDEPPKAK